MDRDTVIFICAVVSLLAGIARILIKITDKEDK